MDALTNPVWAALTTNHRSLATCTTRACRYPGDVVPFAAIRAADTDALDDLVTLLEGEEAVWLVGVDPFTHAALQVIDRVDCLQMVMPPSVAAPEPAFDIASLSSADASEMLALTSVAFPGFYRARTHLLGTYFGIRRDGQLVAMAGERFACGNHREVSAVCTHPSYRGQGLAPAVMWHLIEHHRQAGIVSWLHVATTNLSAIRLYRGMGFIEHATIRAVRVARA